MTSDRVAAMVVILVPEYILCLTCSNSDSQLREAERGCGALHLFFRLSSCSNSHFYATIEPGTDGVSAQRRCRLSVEIYEGLRWPILIF